MPAPEYRWFQATKDGEAWLVAAMPGAPDIVLSITSDLSSPLDQALAAELAIQQAVRQTTHPTDYMICRIDARQPNRVECWYKRCL
jgi:hypothetical protein